MTQGGLEAEIVETTFRSRFRFRFLKYPLFKKVVSFRVPEILFLETFGNEKRNESKRNGNVPEPSEILGTKKSFPLSLSGGGQKLLKIV